MKLSPVLRLIAISALILSLFNCGGGSSSGDDGNNSGSSNNNSALSSSPILSLIDSSDTFGQARGVLIDGDKVYVADGSSGLVVMQITGSNNIQTISSLQPETDPVLGRAYSLAKKGNYLYVAAVKAGLYVIDVSDPFTPILVNTILFSDDPKFLFIKDNLLFVSADSYFVIMDITDPASPVIIKEMFTSTGSNQHLVIENNIAYIAAYNKGLRIIGVSNPSSPVLLSETNVGYNVVAIAKVGNYIYIGGMGSGLFVYDVTNPAKPLLAANISLPVENGESLYDIVKWGNFLFVADGPSGIQIVDITTPANPVLVDSTDTSSSAQSLLVDNLTLIVADNADGIYLFNIIETTDRDGDGIQDGYDVFPDEPSEWADADGDGTGDNADLNDDNDGYLDENDAFPTDPSEWIDTDGDGVGDNTDVFINDPLEWSDSDNDGIGNNADLDDDNDGLLDVDDPYPADPFNLINVTNDAYWSRYPKLDNNKIAWRGYLPSGKATVLYKDLSDPNSQEVDLAGDMDGFIGVQSISNGQVAWRVWDKNGTGRNYIYLWDGSSRRTITDYPTGSFGGEFGYPPSYHSLEVSLDNGQMAWAAWDGTDYEIFFWDGNSIRQITDNSVDDYEAQLSNGQIAWTAYEGLVPKPVNWTSYVDVFFWDGNVIHNISDRPGIPDEDAHLMNGQIAWSGYNNSTYKRDIYFWDGQDVKLINALDGQDYEPQIDNSGNFITWVNEKNSQYTIYVWDGYAIIQLPPIIGFSDLEAFANNGKVAFTRNGTDSSNIYIADFRLDKDGDGVMNSIDPFPLDPLR